jgi:ATP-binding cassette, subfamily B, bacterial
VLLHGRDIRSYTPEERAQKIGFILQDPFLFSGTVRDTIVYGNPPFKDYSSQQLASVLEEANLSSLISRFSEGLDTVVTTSGNSISLGQKQLIAFMHRLNTIDNVDQIFFVNSGEITLAGSMEHAVDMLLHEKRAS